MLNMKPEPDQPPQLGSAANVNGNGNTILRVESAAGEGLDELFKAVINGDVQSRLPQQVPMRQRRLPPSFFRPPSAGSSTNSVNHSRESSLDGGYQSGQTAVTPATNGQSKTPNNPVMGFTSNGLAVIHPRANSSPASLQPATGVNGLTNGQSFGVNGLKNGVAGAAANGGTHFRQMSYDVSEMRLPDGWEMSFTPNGERYFLNHKDKTTTWDDPRKMILEEALMRVPSTGSVHSQPPPPHNGAPPIIQQVLSSMVVPQTPQEAPDNYMDPSLVPLPKGWELARTPSGDIYFMSHIDQTTSWFHPEIPEHLQMRRLQQNHSTATPPPFHTNNSNIPPELVAALENMNCQTPSTPNTQPSQQQNQNLRDLELERERMRQRQEELLQNNLLTSNASNILLSSTSEPNSTNVQSPFMRNECHSRQESADSGLDLGNSSNYSMPHTPDDFLRVSSATNGGSSNSSSNGAGGPGGTLSALTDDLTFESMQISGLDLDPESMDFMQGIDSMDLLSNVEELLESNQNSMLNMTWL